MFVVRVISWAVPTETGVAGFENANLIDGAVGIEARIFA